jgi:uncharacterized protein YndB with AHSA1/START domain
MPSFSTTIRIAAPVDAVWKVLSDLDSIDRWNPGVLHSRGTPGHIAGVGAGRHCLLPGDKYIDEEVADWRPGERLTMRIVATNLPLKSADIRFTLSDGGGMTLVTVTPDYTVKYGNLGKVLDLLIVRRRYQRSINALLAGLKRHLENGGS